MQSQSQSIQKQPLMDESHLGIQTLNEWKPQEQAAQSQETKSPSASQQASLNDNGSSKIWPDIGGSKQKQLKEVIQIMEEKSSVSQVDSTENGTKREAGNSFLRPYYIVEPRPKEDYWNKDSIVANELYLKDQVEQKQNALIYQAQIQRLFPNKDKNSQEYQQLMKKSLDVLMAKKPSGSNLIRLVDLLYKKYIISAVKQSHFDTQKVDIYKQDLVRGEKYYHLNDNSLKNETKLQANTNELVNSFKRPAIGRGYPESHIDNESTATNGDSYQNIAVKYMNGMRKEKLIEPQEKSQFPPRQPEKKPPVRPQLALPFDIQIPHHTARKQFNPGYNLFQGPDDEKNQRFEQERTIAKTFVKDGYGLQIVRNYMPNIDGGAYNRAITTIIRESYKKIEDFLLKQCNIKIHSLTSSEFSLVKTPLVHCRNILSDEDRSTFFKYIAITYKFGKMRQDIFPTADQTLRLYKAIVRGLNDRKAAKEMNPKPSKEKDMYFGR